jgi:monoamine oxidase
VLGRRQFLEWIAAAGCVAPFMAPTARAQGLGTDYDVIVIGAGVAGLVAAQRLVAASGDLKVLVLEARDRTGGRVLSVDRPEILRHAELGAQFLPQTAGADWSALDELNLAVTEMAPDRYTAFPGISALTSGIADASVGTLQLNSAVTEVFWREGLVGVRYLNRGLEGAVTARRLVVTVPPTVLRNGDIAFTPELPVSKREALNGVRPPRSIASAAVFTADSAPLTAPENGWLREDKNSTLRAFRAGKAGEILLEAQYHGARAEALAGQPPTLIQALALKDFAEVIEPLPDIRDALWAQTIDWTAEKYSRGARLEVAGAGTRLGLAESVYGTLYFAGDCTQVSAEQADLASAYASGERAAREVALSLSIELDAGDEEAPILELF